MELYDIMKIVECNSKLYLIVLYGRMSYIFQVSPQLLISQYCDSQVEHH